jgi:hypothetical protein
LTFPLAISPLSRFTLSLELKSFRYHTYRKQGGLIVNQTADEGCLSRATTCPERSRDSGVEGSLFHTMKDFYPESPSDALILTNGRAAVRLTLTREESPIYGRSA